MILYKKIYPYKKRSSSIYAIILGVRRLNWDMDYHIYDMKIYSTNEVYLQRKSLYKSKINFNKEIIFRAAREDLGLEDFYKKTHFHTM